MCESNTGENNCSEEADQLEATLARLNKLIFPDPWQLNQLFSPLHGGRVRVIITHAL